VRHPTATLLALLLPLAACLEIEEEVEVRADGSASVTVRAKGDQPDLDEGFPVPTWGAWRGADATTLAWLSGEPLPEDSDGVTLQADFASVAELPGFFAPPGEPYRSAYLRRTSELQVLRKGARSVYVFTRTLGARRQADWSASARIDAGLDDDLREALEAERDLTPEQWERAVTVVRRAYSDASRSIVRAALSGVYTLGDASLPLGAFERVLARVDRDVAGTITEPRLRNLYALLRNASAKPDDEREVIPPELDLDRLTREAVRTALGEALAAEGLETAVRNAVFEGLEWSFTALDQTADLGDEKLRLRLRLPGRIVDGNFTELDEQGAAVFEVEGPELSDREVVWRAVSVLE
jgi:hypothetical protein